MCKTNEDMAIHNYKPLLIAAGSYGVWDEDASKWGNAFDTYASYGICVKSSPFAVCLEQKNIITQDWNDKNGNDVYLPETPYYTAEELSLEFAIVDDMFPTEPESGVTPLQANIRIANFINAIKSKWLCMYDTYTQIGRKKKYLKGPDGQPEYWRRGSGNNYHTTITFKLKFMVNDPELGFSLTLGQKPSFTTEEE